MVAAEQELNSVVNLLSAVSPRTCQIFIAHRGGYSYKEIGAAYGVKPRTVEKHVASASTILRRWSLGSFAEPLNRRLPRDVPAELRKTTLARTQKS